MPEQNEHKNKFIRELTISLINGLFSITSAIIVAYLVSSSARESTIASVNLSNKSAETIASEQLKLQKEQIDITNKNQLVAIQLTAEKNLEVQQKNATISRNLQELQFQNEKDLQIEKENRENAVASALSISFIESDINARISLIYDEMRGIKEINNSIHSIKFDDEKTTFYLRVKLMIRFLESLGASSFDVNEDFIAKQLTTINNPTATEKVLGFYRLVKLQYAQKMEKNEFHDLEQYAEYSLQYFDQNPENFSKKSASIDNFFSMVNVKIGTTSKFMMRTIALGNLALLELCKISHKDCSREQGNLKESLKEIKQKEDDIVSLQKWLKDFEKYTREIDTFKQ